MYYLILIISYDINHGELDYEYSKLLKTKDEALNKLENELEEYKRRINSDFELDDEYIEENFIIERSILELEK